MNSETTIESVPSHASTAVAESKPVPRKALRLSDRDYNLLGALRQSRALTALQLKRLFFPVQSNAVFDRRLKLLERAGLLRRLHWYSKGERNSAATLTPEGFHATERITSIGEFLPDHIAETYFAHQFQLTDLYVGLLEQAVTSRLSTLNAAGGGKQKASVAQVYARIGQLPFRWLLGGCTDLPWRQRADGDTVARLLRPDAILELPGLRRRIFVECETGSHAVVSASPNKLGATQKKLERYRAYCLNKVSAQSDATFYAARFPDNFAAEVLFLVANQSRVDSIQAIIPKEVAARVRFRAATLESALALLQGELKGSNDTADAPAPARVEAHSLTQTELKNLQQFFTAVVEERKQRQRAAQAAGAPPVEHHAATAEVRDTLKRLLARPQ